MPAENCAYPPCFRPSAVCTGGACAGVSGTTNALAVHAGNIALQAGGNAMDACLATAAAQCVLASNSYVSFAGVAKILYYDAASGVTVDVDGDWTPVFNNNASAIPSPADIYSPTIGAGVLVPGFFAAVETAAAKAVFPLATLLQPALYFAEVGAPLSPLMGAIIANNYNWLNRTVEGARIFTNPATKQARAI